MKIFKERITLLVSLFSFMVSYSQNAPYTENIGSFSMDAKTSINLGNLMGRPFSVTNYDNIKGTPYFTDSFVDCHIMLQNGNVYIGPKMRLNLFTQQLHFLTPDNNERVTGDGAVKKVVFYKRVADSVMPFIFSSGYPAIDNNSELTYYEQENSGKAVLLKLTVKTLNNSRSLTASPLDKEFGERTFYYVFNSSHSKMDRWRKGATFITEFLTDKKDDILKFIESNNLSCKTPEDIKKIMSYYDTLK